MCVCKQASDLYTHRMCLRQQALSISSCHHCNFKGVGVGMGVSMGDGSDKMQRGQVG